MRLRHRGGPWLAAVGLAPFAVAVTVALIGSLLSIAGEPHPYFGDPSGVEIDAGALARGGALYQDPAAGYTPLNYPPLMPAAAAALDQLAFWDGWTALLSLLSGVALAAIAAAHAWRPELAGRVTAIGAGALAWWLVACVPFNFLYAPRPDELSWALALGGLLALPAAARGSGRAAVAMIVLLTAAMWTKQTAVAAAVAAVPALAWFAISGRSSWRRAAGLVATLAVVNALILAVLSRVTDGWTWVFLVDVPGGGARINSLHTIADRAVTALLLPFAFAVVTWGTVALTRGQELEERDRERLVVLGAFTALALVFAFAFGAKQGTAHNQFLGVAWGLAIAGAMACGLATETGATAAAVAAVAALALFGLASSERLRASARAHLTLAVPGPSPRAFVDQVPAALRETARQRSVFHPVYSGLALPYGGPAFPNHNNIQDLLAGGERPGYLIKALLDRRFDVAYLFEDGPARDAYASAYGAREDNMIWKLDQVIRAGYERWPGAPAGLRAAQQVPGLVAYSAPGPLRRRPSGAGVAWMRSCFAPFQVTGGAWEIGRGGGFWCRTSASRIRLVRTPAAASELRSDGTRGGTLAVATNGGVTISAGGQALRVDAREARLGGSVVSLPAARRRRITVELGGTPSVAAAGGELRARLPRGTVSVLADARSGTVVDTHALR